MKAMTHWILKQYFTLNMFNSLTITKCVNILLYCKCVAKKHEILVVIALLQKISLNLHNCTEKAQHLGFLKFFDSFYTKT